MREYEDENFRMTKSLMADLERWSTVLTKELTNLDNLVKELNNSHDKGDKEKIEDKFDHLNECVLRIGETAEQTLGLEVNELENTPTVMNEVKKFSKNLNNFKIAVRDLWKASDLAEDKNEAKKSYEQSLKLFNRASKTMSTSVTHLLEEIEEVHDDTKSLSTRKIL